MPFDFLSDEWVAEARKIRAGYKSLTAPVTNQVRINLVVTEVPQSGQIDAHVDTYREASPTSSVATPTTPISR